MGGDDRCHLISELKNNCQNSNGAWKAGEAQASTGCWDKYEPAIFSSNNSDWVNDAQSFSCKCPQNYCIDPMGKCIPFPKDPDLYKPEVSCGKIVPEEKPPYSQPYRNFVDPGDSLYLNSPEHAKEILINLVYIILLVTLFVGSPILGVIIYRIIKASQPKKNKK